MKILYITTVDCGLDSGARKKIYGQVKAMNKSGLDVGIIAQNGDRISVISDNKVSFLSQYNNKGFLSFFNLTAKLYELSYDYVRENSVDAVFIRYALADWSLIKMLKRLKEKGVKILMEIPSYPYDLEYDNKQLYKRVGLYIDRFFRKGLYKYVDMIFTPSPKQKNIYGVKTRCFNNAVDIQSISKREYVGPEKNKLKFIGVANVNPWHGYDRIIRGMADYYENGGDLDFTFNIVGDGIDIPNLRRITKESGLEKRVIFNGKKYGKELDWIYNNSDIAVGSVGFFRLNSMERTSLKTREACLKGIPFVGVKGDPVFDEGFKYMYLVEDKNKPVDVESVYNWFQKLDPNVYVEDMYKFGVNSLGWDKNFKSVISNIKKIVENDKGNINKT